MSFLKEIKEMLATWQATAMLIFLLSLAMGSATFLETGLGTEAALSVIYHLRPFIAHTPPTQT